MSVWPLGESHHSPSVFRTAIAIIKRRIQISTREKALFLVRFFVQNESYLLHFYVSYFAQYCNCQQDCSVFLRTLFAGRQTLTLVINLMRVIRNRSKNVFDRRFIAL